MCVTFFFVSPKALITLPSESNPLLICTDSAVYTCQLRTLLFCICSCPYQMIQLAIQYDTTLISIHKMKLSLHYNYRPQRICEGYVSTPVCLSTGGSASVHAGIPLPRADTPPLRAGITPPPGADPPPRRRLLLRTVRILLECILVQ